MTVQRDILDGSGFLARTNAATEESAGWYTITLTAAEMNGPGCGTVLKITATGCDDVNTVLIYAP